MNKIDRLMLGRVLPRVAVTIVVFFGLLALVESLDTYRFRVMSAAGGLPLALLADILPAIRWSIGALPITILLGTIAGVLDLQRHAELTAMKAAGFSIWQIMRAPLLAISLLAFVFTVASDTPTILADRALPAHSLGMQGDIWLEQAGEDARYVLTARHAQADPPLLDDVQIFDATPGGPGRIVAKSAKLQAGHWRLTDAVRYSPNVAPETFARLDIATRTTPGDIKLEISGAKDLTFPEMVSAATSKISNAQLRSAALTNLFRIFSLPFMVMGSVLIGFAFTSGYRRKNDYGQAALHGLVAGFVLFVVNELAIRSGSADVLPPLLATAAPAIVSIIVGLTALLYLEDGRA